MTEYDLDTEHSILHVQPKSAIEQDDFVKLAKAVDPHIEATGGLAGLIIDTPSAPGHRGPLVAGDRRLDELGRSIGLSTIASTRV